MHAVADWQFDAFTALARKCNLVNADQIMLRVHHP